MRRTTHDAQLPEPPKNERDDYRQVGGGEDRCIRPRARAKVGPFLAELKGCDILHFDRVNLMFWFVTFWGKNMYIFIY